MEDSTDAAPVHQAEVIDLLTRETRRRARTAHESISRPKVLADGRAHVRLQQSAQSLERLTQVLADTITLKDLYKKHRRQILESVLRSLAVLYRKHGEAQAELAERIARRIQLLGGVSLIMSADIAELTMIPRPPREKEAVPAQISRLLRAHEVVICNAQSAAAKAGECGDVCTRDLMLGQVLHMQELQVWILSEYLAEANELAQ